MSVRRWGPLVGWAVLILIATTIPVPNVSAPHWTDKVVHVALYLPLGYFTARAFDGALRRRTAMLAAVAFVVAFAIADEYHQRFVPGRSSDPRDAVADTVGGLLGVLAAARRDRRGAARSDAPSPTRS